MAFTKLDCTTLDEPGVVLVTVTPSSNSMSMPAKGLNALSEAEYIGLEDQYQNIMRNYGLPASYYTRAKMKMTKSNKKNF